MKCTLLFVMALLVVTAIARADIITLKNGRVVDGRLYRQNGHYVIKPTSGGVMVVGLGDVASVELQTTRNPAEKARQAWQFLIVQINRKKNVGRIIDLITTYLKTYPHSPFRSQAEKTLAQFQKYQTDGFVRFSGRWVSLKTRSELLAKCRWITQTARQLLRNGKIIQAVGKSRQALAIDPAYTDALIIGGVAERRLGNMPGATRLFRTVLAAHPRNTIALNDLAIVRFDQHEQPAALRQYQKAINLEAGNRLLLDNISAALRAYQGSHRAILYRRLQRTFALADRQMRIRMAKKGLYRFGNTWVNARERAYLNRKNRAYQHRKENLAAQYKAAQIELQSVNTQLRQIKRRIAALINTINYSEFNQEALFMQGVMIFLPNEAMLNSDTAALTQAQSQQVKLRTQRVQIQASIQNIRLAAAEITRKEPTAMRTDIQRMMLPGDLKNVPPPLPLAIFSNTGSGGTLRPGAAGQYKPAPSH